MDKFAALRAFVTVVEEEGFSAAGRRLGLSRSAVNRLVIMLEDEFNMQLLSRTTRQVAPTATGVAFFERASSILKDLESAEREVRATQTKAVGRLRVSAPMSFGTLYLGPAIADFLTEHEDLRLELSLNDRPVDIVSEGYDLVVRIGVAKEEATLVNIRMGEAKRVICAAPDFLSRFGQPVHPGDLKQLPCLHYGHFPGNFVWFLNGPEGQLDVKVNSVFCSNNGEVLRDVAVKGLGVVMLPAFIVGQALKNGNLQAILTDYCPPTIALTIIYPKSRHLAVKIKLFADFLVNRFGHLLI